MTLLFRDARLGPGGLVLWEATTGNYAPKVLDMAASGALLREKVARVAVYHDDSCRIFRGGPCDCRPVVKMVSAATGQIFLATYPGCPEKALTRR